jgi:hypothetical protein
VAGKSTLVFDSAAQLKNVINNHAIMARPA